MLPGAIRAVSRDAGGQPVQLVGWSLGGLFSLLAAAGDPGLPIASAAVIAAPVDASAVRLAAPLRPLLGLTRGSEADLLGHLVGGIPGPLAKRACQAARIDKYMLRPYQILAKLDDRDFLAQVEAADHLTDMNDRISRAGRAADFPGPFAGQALMRGGMEIGGRRIDSGTSACRCWRSPGGRRLAPVRSVR